MDLIDAISKILHFQYRFELVPDGKVSTKVQIVSLYCFFVPRQVRVVQQNKQAVGRSGEAFIGSSKSLSVCV